MSQFARTAIFGVTPLSLVLGRACCLSDRPPVGLYDPDGERALRGSLFLGVSALQKPSQLDPPEAPLEVALVGTEDGLAGLRQLIPREDLLVLTLGPWNAEDFSTCYAERAQSSEEFLIDTITASIPSLTFQLHGLPDQRERARVYLRTLSPGFNVS